ncbi:alpha-amylase family glycosyl hydrolase [Luteimonas sp. TWI662]|uniref:alpha-amylase family glycosyl hydrolase n=1 Tax=Luteimonas sp. TWI662 TaxID=3136789 RepID=UPI00320AF756
MQRRTRACVRGIALACLSLIAGAASAGDLHVPSPDWRDQIVYFLMIDRFDDGDPSNNDQGTGEYDPKDPARYSGGDLAGVTRRLDYVQGLGATAVWITPPVAHQWWNEATRYGGYHGYWADDFSAIDPHFGTREDYRALSRGLHGRGMYLIQDIVVNHTANYFGYSGGWRADDPAAGFVRFTDARGRQAPVQPPFDRNDARDPAQRRDAIYHWTPDIVDFTDRTQELTYQLAGLDDLNTEHPEVRRALRRSYGDWIRDVGVDAFRVDTALHVPADFFDDFLHADDRDAPGIFAMARATGREDFHVFGEGFAIDKPFEDSQARRLEAYMRTESGGERLPGMINFPLYGSLGDVFARGEPTAVLGHRIASMVALHPRLHWMPSFVDNHDVDRFLAGADTRALRQALLAMMTLPGIPTLYAGTEQGFTGRRTAMFAGGVGAQGDAFDTAAPLYREIAAMSALRLDDRLFSRGVPEVLRDSGGGPGALVWVTRHDDALALVAFNTADAPVLVDALETGLPAGTRLEGVFGLDGDPAPMTVAADGRLTLVLPPRAGLVWRQRGSEAPPEAPQGTAPKIETLPPTPWRDDVVLRGRAAPGDVLQVVVDGDLQRAPRVVAGADGRWTTTLRTDSWIDPARTHRLVLWRETDRTVSTAQPFRVERRWRAAARTDDPAGDDHGLDGRVVYPLGGQWRTQRQGDLRAMDVETSGGALRVTLRMASVTQGWNPPNGFDHVAPVVFIELPDRARGSELMPQQNARLPDGMRWHYRIRAHGWSNALFSAQGADADAEGTPQAQPARIEVDPKAATIRFTLPASSLGDPVTLTGARVHAVTWDYDDGFRPLRPEASASAFGGGDGRHDARVLDAVGPLRLR